MCLSGRYESLPKGVGGTSRGEVGGRGSHVEWHLNGNLKHFSGSFLSVYIFNLTLTENLNETNVSCCVVSCSVLSSPVSYEFHTE